MPYARRSIDRLFISYPSIKHGSCFSSQTTRQGPLLFSLSTQSLAGVRGKVLTLLTFPCRSDRYQCLNNVPDYRSPSWKDLNAEQAARQLPGQLSDLDAQCRRAFGVSFEYCKDLSHGVSIERFSLKREKNTRFILAAEMSPSVLPRATLQPILVHHQSRALVGRHGVLEPVLGNQGTSMSATSYLEHRRRKKRVAEPLCACDRVECERCICMFFLVGGSTHGKAARRVKRKASRPIMTRQGLRMKSQSA